jgi:hypothetical protein
VFFVRVLLACSGSTASNGIVFGGRLLEQFYAVLDMRSPSRVGLAQQDSSVVESRVQCAARVLCSGMQVHYEPLNSCMAPACGDYYFFTYDASHSMCKLSPTFHIVVGVLVAAFILAEVGLNEAVLQLSKRVAASGEIVKVMKHNSASS